MADTATDLNGKRIVVVEDDFNLGTAICRDLAALGATVLGPAPTPFYAMQAIGHRRLDAAVLDVCLHGTLVFAIADMLHDRGVPLLFMAAPGEATLPRRFAEAQLLEKPFRRQDMVRAVIDLCCQTEKIEPDRERPALGGHRHADMMARALARSLTSDQMR